MTAPGSLTPQAWQLLSSQPAGMPPPGQKSHLHGPLTPLFSWGVAVVVIQLFITVVAVPIRLYTRWQAQHKWDVEDILVFFAVLLEIGDNIVILQGTAVTYTQHIWNITIGQLLHGLKAVYVGQTLWGVTILLLKVAILLQFLRLFVPQRRNTQFPYVWYGCWILIVCHVIFYTIITGLGIGICDPIAKFWYPFMEGHCLEIAVVYKATGIMNSISDFTILLIPIPVIASLNMPLKKKLGILSIFGVGVFALVASILRTYFTWHLFKSGADTTYKIAIVEFCCWGEFAMGILAFCLPVFPQFVRLMKEKMQKRKENKIGTPPSQSSSDLEMNAEQTPTKKKEGRFMEVSLASFEVDHSQSDLSANSH